MILLKKKLLFVIHEENKVVFLKRIDIKILRLSDVTRRPIYGRKDDSFGLFHFF